MTLQAMPDTSLKTNIKALRRALRKLYLFFSVISMLLVFSCHGSAEEIVEAQGLEPETSPSTVEYTPEQWHHRSSLSMEGLTQQQTPSSRRDFPIFEAHLYLDYKAPETGTFFLDGFLQGKPNSNESTIFLNQFGLRYEPKGQWTLAIGKERNRRSPGILFSPSDLLLTQTNPPGIREDRKGTWLIRSSLQRVGSSYDLLVLPSHEVNEQGLPVQGSQVEGTLLRTLQQWDQWDLSLTLGKLNSLTHYGLALQGVLAQIWKIYYEMGSNPSLQQLVGLSYEGSDDFNCKVESFNQSSYPSQDLSIDSKHFLLFTISILEIQNHFNWIASLIQSVENSARLSSMRGEYILNDRLVFGGSGIFLHTKHQNPFLFAPFHQQLSLDLKYSF